MQSPNPQYKVPHDRVHCLCCSGSGPPHILPRPWQGVTLQSLELVRSRGQSWVLRVYKAWGLGCQWMYRQGSDCRNRSTPQDSSRAGMHPGSRPQPQPQSLTQPVSQTLSRSRFSINLRCRRRVRIQTTAPPCSRALKRSPAGLERRTGRSTYCNHTLFC